MYIRFVDMYKIKRPKYLASCKLQRISFYVQFLSCSAEPHRNLDPQFLNNGHR